MSLQDSMSYFYNRHHPWLVSQGELYYSNSFIQDLAMGESVVVLGRVPLNKSVRFSTRLTDHTSDDRLEIELFEDVTVGSEGTPVETHSYNRNRAIESGFKIFNNPSLSNLTNRIERRVLLGTDGIGDRVTMSSTLTPESTERELKRGSDYALRFTNYGNTCDVTTFLQWYEVTQYG